VFKNNNELNANEDVINFKNGVLRLSDMALLPHSPRLLSTIQIPCVWTGQPSDTPVFDSFIAELTNWDKAIENLLLEFVGACISNIKGHRMKKALFMVGLGDTGKSRLKELTETLLGKGNYFPIDLRELEERFATGNVYNKRLIGSSDMSFLTVKELKIFKKLTGGDSIPAEFKGVQGFNFTYCGLMWFCMNKLPKFGGDDGEWVHERIIQVECKNKIPPERQDKFLLDKMYEERNGIIYKAVMALRNVITNGYKFSEPDSVIVARRKYMEENNTVIAFFDECMVKRPTAVIPTNDGCTTGRVYDVYKAWCKDNNHGYAKTAKEFRDELAQHLGFSFSEISVRRGKGGTFYRRYTLSDEAKSQYHDAYGNNYMFTVG
jgi:P4 family phage/plasmid primase-like protien